MVKDCWFCIHLFAVHRIGINRDQLDGYQCNKVTDTQKLARNFAMGSHVKESPIDNGCKYFTPESQEDTHVLEH
jgi:hypothetical protein